MTSKADRIEVKRQQHAADEHELDLFLNTPQRSAEFPASTDADTRLIAGPLKAAKLNNEDSPRGSTDTGALLPGLVIIKQFLTPQEQQELVDDSRCMGLGEGGFYKPTYASGAKCRLHQMCLGRHWNVKTEKYEDQRSNYDYAPIRTLPDSWKTYAQRSLDAAKKIDPLVMGSCKKMTPDICVVNFYKKAGRNGMHIDKDESDEAMSMGSPVISFSVGCAAEFAYIDHYPDPHEAVPIVRLESGDALVFGGPARTVVHALTRVYNNTQPSWLRMRSGRLNLTFREYKPSELES
ncbi:2OG-Fe(II) oxygenase superfamily [Phytophthora infestans]|uniref:2OG-Fe(II) oxygenase superfamily n=1 Tax=Phytophthora infestans TaxID=4787 RepID=A0A8S9VG03_PHYIN|nr:2OG-Fe(II) oxygenase superfamily [Phytophthora infestans]